VRPLAASEVVDLARYSAIRSAYRARVIAYKRTRRLAVGDRVSLVFEDRETLRFQVQEMLFVERISAPERIQDELDVYNELVPGADELSATLFVEVTDLARVRPELDRLVGIDEHVLLEVGSGAGAASVRADFDARQLEEDRISAVQYLRFRLPPPVAARFADASVPARIRIDHPRYAALAELPPEVRASLAATLRAEPEPLLPTGVARAAAPDAIEHESARVRVLRPGGSSDHWIVEPREPRSLLDADPELLRELAAALQLAARRLTAQAGACRIEPLRVQEGAPLRWHLVAARRAR
jgi:Protein of unknown function (DUF3501)